MLNAKKVFTKKTVATIIAGVTILGLLILEQSQLGHL